MPTVQILGKTYTLAPLTTPDVRMRRRALAQALQQARQGDEAPLEVVMLLMYASLGLLARRWSPVPWRTPVAAYGEAVSIDAVERCPPDEQDRLLADMDAAALVAWRYCWDLPADEVATEAGAKAAADFSEAPPTAGTPR